MTRRWVADGSSEGDLPSGKIPACVVVVCRGNREGTGAEVHRVARWCLEMRRRKPTLAVLRLDDGCGSTRGGARLRTEVKNGESCPARVNTGRMKEKARQVG
ncbi:hypothetical protein L1987_57138 [Smallanthus sonchifolius]|uniref:Uncharacterized protein n=1 Tax=Smallanthus sonchifolius TaxID=185202 RepID=A0ACB9DC74_9ASTR|nr:hypothetical protein L1987_57138 [Smallanthus sonchifolius]